MSLIWRKFAKTVVYTNLSNVFSMVFARLLFLPYSPSILPFDVIIGIVLEIMLRLIYCVAVPYLVLRYVWTANF